MTWSKITGTIAAGALIVGSVFNVAAAQGPAAVIPEGRVFTFHSKPTGTCPALDWHIVMLPNNVLTGMIGWDDMKSMARVTGIVGSNRTFKMTGMRVSGGPSSGGATIEGQVRQDGWLVANIHGPNVNCQGITVPWFIPPPSGGG